MRQPNLAQAATKPAAFTSFGALLKYLRRRERLTQRDLALAVGYTEAHLCRLEKNQRLPDQTTVAALFVPALGLEHEPAWAERLLQLAATSRQKNLPAALSPEVDQALPLLEGIPPLPPHHVTRPLLLARLRQHLAAERGVALCGLAGVGKTTLAVTYARERAAIEPVFWLTLTPGVTASVEALVRRLALFLLAQGQTEVKPLALLTSDDAPPIPLDQQIALIGAALSQQPALLCFDDLHLAREDIAILALFRHLLTTTRASLLLISREETPLPGVAYMRLAGLERAEGLALVERLVTHTPGADAQLHPHAERLLDRTGGNPMLLKLAIGQIHDNLTTPARFIDYLETQPQVAAYILETVLRDLSPAAMLLTELLSVFRQPINLYDESWPELLQETLLAQDQAAAMTELQRRHLIDHPAQAALHPLVRDHVYATLSARGKHKRRLHRLAAQWFEFTTRDILEAAHHYLCAGQLAQAVEALTDQVETLLNQGQVFNAAALVDTMLAQAQQVSKPSDRQPSADTQELIRQLLTIRGDLLVHTLRTAEAEENYRQALLLTTQPEVWANIVHRLAGYLLQHGQGHEAARICREAASLVPNHTWLLAQLAAIESAARASVGDCEGAERVANQALALASQLLPVMPHLAEGVRTRAYGTLGEAQRYQSRPQAALDSWQNAITAARRAGLRRLEYRYPGNMGLMLVELGRLEETLQLCNQALAELNAIGDSYAAAQTLAVIAYVHHVRGDQVATLELTEQAGDLRRRLGDFAGAAMLENIRVWALFLSGRIAEALALAESNKRELEKLGSTWLTAPALDTLSITQMVAGELQQARMTLRQAFAMPDVIDKWIHHFLFDDLALLHLACGEVAEAQQTLDEAPPTVGLWQEMDRLLARGAVALGRGDSAGATALAAELAKRAAAIGYQLYTQRAARLVEAIHNPPPLAELPRFLWVDTPEH
jgi:ATP/maltotriose-dependent transcriptional regulator MalT/DNA-binding XRE family transcriptional regulator